MRSLALVLAGMGMATAMAFADQAEAEGFKVGRIVKQGTHPYFTAETVGMREAAAELGIEFLYQDVETDTDLTISALDTMIAAGVDAIAITVPDQRSGPAVMARAKEAGIVLITPYDPISDDEGNVAPYIGPSSPELGRMAGGEAVRIYGDLGWASEAVELRVAAIEAQQIEPCMERSDNATAEFLAGTGIGEDQVIRIPIAPQTTEQATIALATVGIANPQATHWVVFGCDDSDVVGGIRGLEEAGYTAESILAVGPTGSTACAEWAHPEETGFRAAIYLDAGANGKVVLQTIHEALTTGEPLALYTGMPGFSQTRDNHPMMSCE
jgi:L-arabinose transport system substrate-binding protein